MSVWNLYLLLGAAGAQLAPARIELISGRADVAARSGVVNLIGPARTHTVDGPAYLEVGPASVLALRWRGEASLELRGVSALEWRAPRDGQGVIVSAWRLTELDFEVRRGPLRIDLGGGWRVELEVGAAGVRTLADGRLELRHVAGSPLVLHREGGAGLTSPPWTLLPGAQLRLDPTAVGFGIDAPSARRVLPPPAPGRPSATPEHPWSGFSWPWTPLDLPGHPEPATELAPAAPACIQSGRIAPASALEELGSEQPEPSVLELPAARHDARTDPSRVDESATSGDAPAS